MKEIWKSIPKFSRYEASNTGKLRSLNYKNSGRVVELRPALDKGYYKTMLVDDIGKNKTGRVHKFVMLAFHGEAPEGTEINHIDGNKENNSLSNLEFVTHKYNVQHSYDNGLQKPQFGSDNGNSKYDEDFVRQIKTEIESLKDSRGRCIGRNDLADKYGVKLSFIKDLIQGRCWNHISV